MTIEMLIRHSMIDAAAIERFEARNALKLPISYRSFLLETNGGRPARPSFPIKGLAMNPTGGVNFFFGLEITSYPVYDLQYSIDRFRGRIPKWLLPIGCNGGSDYICLDLRGGGDRVVFWDHAHFWSTGEWREADLYHIAGSFEEFLAGLMPNPY